MKTLLSSTALALATIVCVTSAWAESSREALEIELSAIESVPSKRALARLGAGVEALLHEIVSSSSRRLARNRALTVLRYYPSKATRELLKKELERSFHLTKGLPVLDMQQALTSYAEVAGPRGLALSRRFLAHKNPDLRRCAAAAVRLSGVKAAKTLLGARLKVETVGFVRYALQKELRRIVTKVRASTK